MGSDHMSILGVLSGAGVFMADCSDAVDDPSNPLAGLQAGSLLSDAVRAPGGGAGAHGGAQGLAGGARPAARACKGPLDSKGLLTGAAGPAPCVRAGSTH